MRIRKISPLLILALLVSTAVLASLSHATDACIGEGTINLASTVTLTTPEGNFTIDFMFLLTITRLDNEYNITVLGKITNITGPPVLLQAKLPLFDFTVSTDEGEYRWSDGKVFTAVMLPVTSGFAYEMSLPNIRSSCIRSVTIDASGLGLPNVVTISEGGILGNVVSGFSQSTNIPPSATTTRSSTPYTVTYSAMTNYLSGKAQPANAVHASTGESANVKEGGIERNAIAAVIALLAAAGVGLLLYTLFTYHA